MFSSIAGILGSFFMNTPIGKFISGNFKYLILILAVLGGIYFSYHYIANKLIQIEQLKNEISLSKTKIESLEDTLSKEKESNKTTLDILTKLTKDKETFRETIKEKEDVINTKVKKIENNANLTYPQKADAKSILYIRDLNEVFCLGNLECIGETK